MELTYDQKRKAWVILGVVAVIVLLLIIVRLFNSFLGTRAPLLPQVSESIVGGQIKSESLQVGSNTLEYRARTSNGTIVSDSVSFDVLPPDPYSPYDPTPTPAPDPYLPY